MRFTKGPMIYNQYYTSAMPKVNRNEVADTVRCSLFLLQSSVVLWRKVVSHHESDTLASSYNVKDNCSLSGIQPEVAMMITS